MQLDNNIIRGVGEKVWFFKKINAFFKQTSIDHVGEYTAGCAYYTFLSFIPFIILLLSLIKYVNIEKEMLVQIFEMILPSIMKNSVLDIIQEMYAKSIETVSISAIFLLWSASKSFYALNLGLSSIYQKEEAENYFFLRLKGIIGAILALILVIAVLILLVFGNSIETAVSANFPELTGFLDFVLHARAIISIAGMFIIFLFLYRISQRKEKRVTRNCIPGALFSAIGWYLVSFFFSIYVNIFTDFSIIYGSLATITIIMMWLYTIIYVLLLGAEINVMLEERISQFFFHRKEKSIRKS